MARAGSPAASQSASPFPLGLFCADLFGQNTRDTFTGLETIKGAKSPLCRGCRSQRNGSSG